MRKQYRFVGSAPCQIGGMEYDRFGSVAQFDHDLAQDVLAGGGCFIPEEDFQDIGFSPSDLANYAYAGAYPEPPAAFVAQRHRAQARARALMANPSIITEHHEQDEK